MFRVSPRAATSREVAEAESEMEANRTILADKFSLPYIYPSICIYIYISICVGLTRGRRLAGK